MLRIPIMVSCTFAFLALNSCRLPLKRCCYQGHERVKPFQEMVLWNPGVHWSHLSLHWKARAVSEACKPLIVRLKPSHICTSSIRTKLSFPFKCLALIKSYRLLRSRSSLNSGRLKLLWITLAFGAFWSRYCKKGFKQFWPSCAWDHLNIRSPIVSIILLRYCLRSMRFI